MYSKLYRLIKDHGLSKLAKLSGALLAQSSLGAVGVLIVASTMQLLLAPEASVAKLFGFELQLTTMMVLFMVSQVILSGFGVITDLARARYLAGFGSWLRCDLLGKTMRREYEYFATRDSAHIQQAIHQYVGQANFLLNSSLELMIKLIMICIYALSALFQAPLLTTVVFVTTIAVYMIIVFMTRKLRNRLNQELKSSDKKMQSLSIQMIQGIKTFMITGNVGIYQNSYRDATKKYAAYQSIAPLLSVFPKYFIEALLFILISVYVLMVNNSGMLESVLPKLGILLFIVFKVFPLMQAAYSNFSHVATNRYLLDRIFEEYANVDQYVKSNDNPVFENTLEVKDLVFCYDDESRIAYPNFKIMKGTRVGVKGASGTGKSTLMDLLLGLYSPTTGEIKVDGKVVDASYLRGLHTKVGYVGQDPFLLHFSIAENIAWKPSGSIDYAKMRKAAKYAEISDFVDGLPDKYETVVGDRGMRLSGGQKQRIAIARALYSEPEILLFDEATSALDNETERRIMDTIYSLPREITILMIAHRLSSLDRVDKIIDLSK